MHPASARPAPRRALRPRPGRALACGWICEGAAGTESDNPTGRALTCVRLRHENSARLGRCLEAVRVMA